MNKFLSPVYVITNSATIEPVRIVQVGGCTRICTVIFKYIHLTTFVPNYKKNPESRSEQQFFKKQSFAPVADLGEGPRPPPFAGIFAKAL